MNATPHNAQKDQDRAHLAVVRKIGASVRRYIQNPSRVVQMAAVQKDGLAIQYLLDPSPAVQTQAVRQNPNALKFISNPSEKIVLLAVHQSGSAIQFVKEPTESVQMAAIFNEPFALEHIKEPTEAAQLAAVQKNGCALAFIYQAPSEAVQLAALAQDFFAISFTRECFTPHPEELVNALTSSRKRHGDVDFGDAVHEVARRCARMMSRMTSRWPDHPLDAVINLLPAAVRQNPELAPILRGILTKAATTKGCSNNIRVF